MERTPWCSRGSPRSFWPAYPCNISSTGWPPLALSALRAGLKQLNLCGAAGEIIRVVQIMLMPLPSAIIPRVSKILSCHTHLLILDQHSPDSTAALLVLAHRLSFGFALPFLALQAGHSGTACLYCRQDKGLLNATGLSDHRRAVSRNPVDDGQFWQPLHGSGEPDPASS